LEKAMAVEWNRRLAAIAVCVLLSLWSTSVPAKEPPATYLTSSELLQRAIGSLSDKIGRPPRIAHVEIEPKTITILTETAPGQPSSIEKWTITRFKYLFFDRDTVAGPEPYRGEGFTTDFADIKGSFFDLSEVKLDRLGEITKGAIEHAGFADPARATSVSIRREMVRQPKPSYGGIYWSISLATNRETATVYTDAAGVIIGADLSNTVHGRRINLLSLDELQ
jgi:hypothetical protein